MNLAKKYSHSQSQMSFHTQTKKQKRLFKVKYSPPSDTHIPRGNRLEQNCTYTENEDLSFQIVDWYSEDVFCENDSEGWSDEDEGSQTKYRSIPDPRQYTIRVFGVTDHGHSVSCIINNFHPYFFVKVPLGWNRTRCEQFVKHNITHKKGPRKRFDKETGDMYTVTEYRDRNFRVDNPDTEDVQWCSFSSALVEWDVVKRCDFNAGFTGIPAKQFKFIKLTFKTLGALKQCYWALRKQKRELKIDIYEANLDPQLRFMHIKNILAAGWVVLPKNTYQITYNEDEAEISTQIETEVDWTDIQPLDRDDIAQMRQASFDIECYSHEHDKFPVPEHPDNPVFQIGTVIQDYGNPDKYIKHLITLKKCDPIKDTIVISCETEYELLCKWQQLIFESDPDILYGYNIFGFDLNYLMVRAEKLGCEQFKFLGRMKYQQCILIDKSLSSAAYGDNRFKMVPMPGRLQIDLLQIMLRGMKKYRSYKLGSISQEILCSKLKENPLRFTEGSTTVFVKHPDHSFKEGTVVHLFSMFKAGGYSYEDINKMHIIINVVYDEENPEKTAGYNIEMWKPATMTEWGGGDDMPRAFETKFDLPPQQIFEKFAAGSPADIQKIGAYCVQDCMLPQKIINKCNILIDTLEMAKVTYVPTSFLITRGQQIKVFSQFAKKCRERGYLVHTVECNRTVKKKKGGKQKYKGATVLSPLSGAYWDGVTCLDFKALYPTTEIDWNLCYTTLVKDEKYANLPGVKYHDFTVGDNTYRFAQSEKGIVPEVLEHLLNARDAAKKQMYAAKTAFMKDVYNGKQLALKVSCNSVYGFTGCGDTGMLPCKPIAEVTTTVGRGMIEQSKEFSENRDNFREVVGCVDWFPLNYYYLCLKPNGKHALLTTDKLFKQFETTPEQLQSAEEIELLNDEDEESEKRYLVWTSEQFQPVTGFQCKKEPFTQKDGTVVDRWLYKVNTVKGDILNMRDYACTTVYGDSVPGYIPLMIKTHNGEHIIITEISKLDTYCKNSWVPYKNFKHTEEGLWDKHCIDLTRDKVYVWTATHLKNSDGTYAGKWTKIRKLIRHKTNKDIYRVTTNRGIVDVTEDHSLISDNHELISPKEIHNNSDIKSTKLCCSSFKDVHALSRLRYMRYKNRPPNDCKYVLDKIYNSDDNSFEFNMIEMAWAYQYLQSYGYNVRIDDDGKVDYNNDTPYNHTDTIIKSITKLGSSNGEYVYDLETKEGTFNAGIGEITIKNTDSVFNDFKTKHHSENCHKIAYSMITGGYVADRITEFLRSLNPYKPYNEQWTELEYEKVYLELMLLTKKRYVGSLYEFNPYKRSYIDKKGVALKRRDYCNFVHDVFKAVLKCIFDDSEPDKDVRIQRAVDVVTKAVDDLLNNRIPFERLILSKLLKGKYKIRDQTKKGSLDSTVIKVDDLVKWEHPEFGMCTGVVRKKHTYTSASKDFFGQFKKPLRKRKLEAQSRSENKDIDVWMTESETGLMPDNPEDMLFHLSYSDLKAKCGYEITLDKIMDPKTPEKDLEKVTQAHARLARKMYKRDPGSAPKSGTRLQYMFVQSKNLKAKQYEKSEHPDYVRKHNLKADYIYYLVHQLKTPMIQLFELWVDDAEGLFRDRMRKYRLDLMGQKEITSFFTKK